MIEARWKMVALTPKALGSTSRWQQVGNQRLAGRQIEGQHRRHQRRDQVDAPQLHSPGERQQPEHKRQHRHDRLGDQDQPAPIEGIRGDPSDHREHDDGKDVGQPHAGQGDGLPAQIMDLPQHGRSLHARPGHRDQQPEAEQAVVAVAQGGWDQGARPGGRDTLGAVGGEGVRFPSRGVEEVIADCAVAHLGDWRRHTLVLVAPDALMTCSTNAAENPCSTQACGE